MLHLILPGNICLWAHAKVRMPIAGLILQDMGFYRFIVQRCLSAIVVQAFMGDVASWTGIVTGTLMMASPSLFACWKWRGVAGATPAFLLWAGVPFFIGCIVYNATHPGGGAGTSALSILVYCGALLQVRLSSIMAMCHFPGFPTCLPGNNKSFCTVCASPKQSSSDVRGKNGIDLLSASQLCNNALLVQLFCLSDVGLSCADIWKGC